MTDLKKLSEATDLLVLEATCYAPEETMVAKYFAVPSSLVVATIETSKPLDVCTQRDVDRLFAKVSFLHRVPERSPPDDGSSSCPESVRAVRPGKGACLAPGLLGESRARRCGAGLERNGWNRNSPMESAVGRETGNNQICYDRPERSVHVKM